jgi:very-short-patch-repair endonuclease
MTSTLERAFLTRWRQLAPDADAPIEQYRWAAAEVGLGPGLRKRLEAAGLRDWRLDFAWLTPRKVAVELQGGTWTRGRHVRGQGYRADCERLNALQSRGWRVFYVTSDMLRDDPAGVVAMVREALCAKTCCT